MHQKAELLVSLLSSCRLHQRTVIIQIRLFHGILLLYAPSLHALMITNFHAQLSLTNATFL